MNDLISRQAAIDALGDMVMNWTDSDYELGQLNQWKADRKAIIDLPSAQPQRMKGRWIPVTNGRGGYECDQCHNYAPSYQDGVEWLSDFCPSCGSDMRGDEDVGKICTV